MPSSTERASHWITVLAVVIVLFAVGMVARDAFEPATGVSGAAARSVAGAGAPAPAGPSPTALRAVGPDRPADRGGEPEKRPVRAPTAGPAGTQREPYVWVRPGRRAELRDGPGGAVVAKVDDRTEFGSPTVFSVSRVRDRWLGVSTVELPNGELGWVRADPDTLRGGYTDIRITVDLSRHEARLFEGGELLRRWPVTVGAPDSPTPTGRFSVTDLFRGGLNPAYGCCAVALSATQPHLPTGWAGGNLIAFHGTDGPLGLDASNGCIRSADRDVRALLRKVPLGAPVIIRP